MKPMLLFEFTKLRLRWEDETICLFDHLLNKGYSFTNGGLEEIEHSGFVELFCCFLR